MAPQTSPSSSSFSYLDKARQLPLPSREEMLRRDPSVAYFWNRFRKIFERAWGEWADTEEAASLSPLDKSLFDPKLRKAIEEAWEDPTKEGAVRDLWEEVVPGVYQCQFFDSEKLGELRKYLELASDAGIPTRPPYGIVLNRGGFMLDPRSEGYLAIPEFQKFYRNVMDVYMRPLGRLFFPEYINAEDDSQTFGFSIQYQAGKDRSIRQHTDASSLTLNINLNRPDEEYSGSSLYFVDPETRERNLVNFSPGMAVIHRGGIPHAALPIESGERSNIVLWLYGKQGRINHWPYSPEERLSQKERWTKPAEGTCEEADEWAPF